MSNETVNGKGRLEALLARQKQVDAALAVERQKVAKKKKRDFERLFRLAGEILLRVAPEDTGFEVAVREKLRIAPGLSDVDRAFLGRMGWQ
jgi:hypothetical protein